MKASVPVERGIYKSKDRLLFVEVIRQELNTGIVHLEVYGPTTSSIEFISGALFLSLFEKTDIEIVIIPSLPWRK